MSDFNAVFAAICSNLEQSGNVKEISTLFSKCTNDRERVRFVLGLKELDDALGEAKRDVSCGKSLEIAAVHRSEGNAYFQKKDNCRALEAYNRSVSLAKGEPLSLAYANRSAVFYDTQDWLHCLRDIQLAFEEGYPKQLEYKLHERQGKCLLKLNRSERALASFKRAKQCLMETHPANERLKELTAMIESLEVEYQANEVAPLPVKSIEAEIEDARRKPLPLNREPNPRMPSASKSVRLVRTRERGRCLIAAENLEPGMTVIAEKAFASILLAEFRTTHCHRCLHWTPGPVPCQHCAQVGFCSTTCRDEAWLGYHRAECGRTDELERADVGKHALLALRTVHGLNHDVLVTASESDEQPGCDDDNDDGRLYDSSDYSTVHGLVTNSEKRSVADLFRRAALAVFLARIGADNRDTAVVASELLRLIQSYPCNAHEIGQMSVPSDTVGQGRLKEVGAAAMPVLSLINHSCDPNVTRVCFGDVICVTVIRPIRQGEELLDNYGFHYATHDLEERQTHLKQQYYFECQCEACSLRWPLYQSIPRLIDSPQHGALAKSIASILEEFVLLPCTPDALRPDKLRGYLAKFAQFVSAIEKDPSIRRPVFEHNNCQEALKQCLGLLATLTP